MNPRKAGPMADSEKECTEESNPERVKNVPKMTRQKVRMISAIFQCLNSPRFSCVTEECR